MEGYMAKFKKGDRVRCISEAHNGSKYVDKKGTIVECVYTDKRYLVDFDDLDCQWFNLNIEEDILELITEPTYQKIEPKVGEKYRVVKTHPNSNLSRLNIGREYTVDKRITGDTFVHFVLDGIQVSETYFTTEYLEKVEEQQSSTPYYDHSAALYRVDLAMVDNYETPKHYTTMQRLTSALKRALSKEKQTLYKAGYINGGLELSGTGREQYVNALFQNDGDHKKAVAEMVAAAEEEINENESCDD